MVFSHNFNFSLGHQFLQVHYSLLAMPAIANAHGEQSFC